MARSDPERQALVGVARQLVEAIDRRQQVFATYSGVARGFCPHLLGFKRGELNCLAYQFAPESTAERPEREGAKSGWRCFLVSRLMDVCVRDGTWYGKTGEVRYQRCIDVVLAEVANWHHS